MVYYSGASYIYIETYMSCHVIQTYETSLGNVSSQALYIFRNNFHKSLYLNDKMRKILFVACLCSSYRPATRDILHWLPACCVSGYVNLV